MKIEIKENQIIFTRTFKAQPKHIFQAYTDATLFKQWFHPEGTTLEIYEFDVRDGGSAFFAIHAPQGSSYTVTHYNEITRPNIIDYYDYFATPDGEIDKSMAGMHNNINIQDMGNGVSQLTATSILPDAKSAQQLLEMGVEEGMNSTFDNLERLLDTK